MRKANAARSSNHFFFSCSSSPSREVTWTVVYTAFPGVAIPFQHFYKIFLRFFYVMPKEVYVKRVFNRVHGFGGNSV